MTRSAALLLALLIATLISLDNANYYFRHPMYETGDAAANSLSVDRAKHFAELYGAYSRWGFHHPGPAYFYVEAFGQWLFFDELKLVPAPLNAQWLTCLIVDAGFFVAALQVFTQWMPARSRWWFLPVAIALAALFFGNPTAARAPAALPTLGAFEAAWPPQQLVLVFLCLLTAGASVAAGRGEDLPLLALAGGSLVHLHVAQPMFVIPCVLLAYVGLAIWCDSQREEPVERPRPWGWRAGELLAGPWRSHRRAHLLAGALLLVFVLPLLVELTRGSQSNLAAIVHHLRDYQGQHKSLLKSLLYFLQFGAFSAYRAGQIDFGAFNRAGVSRYLHANAVLYAWWLLAFGIAGWAIVRQWQRWLKSRPNEATGYFLAWAGVFLFLSVVLTLRWGVMQDGEMFYFNAFFNFGIYYFAGLIAATEIVRIALGALGRWSKRGAGLFEWSAAMLATILCLALFVHRLKLPDGGLEDHLAFHNKIVGAIAASPARGAVKFLDFSQSNWPLAVGIALQLERSGEKFDVPEGWRTMFGPEYPKKVNLQEALRERYRKWALVDPGEKPVGQSEAAGEIPLENGVSLVQLPPTSLDPDQAGIVQEDFRGNALTPLLKLTGWDDGEAEGTWINSQKAVLAFRTAPVGDDVQLTIQAKPLLEPAHGVAAQRLRVLFNGEQIGPELRLMLAEPPPINFTIPAAAWDRATAKAGLNALLELDLPDAASPHALDPASPETRTLALLVSRISFRALRPPAEPAPQPSPSAQTANGGGKAPHEYLLGRGTIPPAECQGVFADGWAEAHVTVLLARTASPSPFLRVEGVALPTRGIVYPYRLTCQAEQGAATDSTITAPGAFSLLIPLPGGKSAANISVHLDFPQTYVPARADTHSQDTRELSVLLHRVAITSAEQPVFTCFRQGWYDAETDAQNSWRWSNENSVVELAAERSGTLVLTADVRSQVAGNALNVSLDGTQFATVPLPKTEWMPLRLQVSLAPGSHLLQFQTRLPGVQSPPDPRVMSFALRNVQFELQ